ncbi:hypothetical protein RclHR1_03460013 [Rhizophagus clarus]|uniref:F-box domain-containing protein n=1 Tax=Rhizophagus clarus TaxID=94130 RepID=A0A2Z6RM21_9GLOM|nr:hypothetical protein RclHR1_03460013 [Rhizophagus clarus]GES74510.1 hypothetical protein GLOIN_2v113493 [Rhizophagus clarus]
MAKLNIDILYFVFEELQDDKKTLYSCLLTNRTCCEIIIPILWRNPWSQIILRKDKSLLNVILSHLSYESKEKLKEQGIKLSRISYQKPLFDYISFCKHLNLKEIFSIVDSVYSVVKPVSLIKKEILILFYNRKIKFTHLYISHYLHIHHIPQARQLFSGLEFLNCSNTMERIDLIGLKEICQSIQELDLNIEKPKNNIGIAKLIQSQKELIKVNFNVTNKEGSCKILENSLVKHANTIQYFRTTKSPITKILSSFVNLIILELTDRFNEKWNCLEDLSLPLLQKLRTTGVPIKVLTNLIKNTNGHLNEISICYVLQSKTANRRIIRTIYQNCPRLKYFCLPIRNDNISELKNLLINCQHLNGLVVPISNEDDYFDWDEMFKILTKSSPIGLFKFKFYFYCNMTIELKSLKYFFDNWKERPPILLKIRKMEGISINNLIKKYKAEGIVAKYNNDFYNWKRSYSTFEWI